MRTALAAVALFGAGAAAHDFWLEASPWRMVAPGPVTLTTLIGTAAASEPWRLRIERVAALGELSPEGWHDAQSGAEAGTPGHATVSLTTPGSHLIALASTGSFSDLPADKFNAYLAEEGLAAVAAWRQAHGATQANGREVYSRRAKAIVQVGQRPTANVTAVIGQTLEIVPDTNPLMSAGALGVRLLYRGRPLSGARIEAESLGNAPSPPPAISDAAGHAAFVLPHRGTWKITSVWSTPVADDPRADFDTIFASLSFSY